MDHTRVNEFGYSGDMMEESAQKDEDDKKELEDKSEPQTSPPVQQANNKPKNKKAKKED